MSLCCIKHHVMKTYGGMEVKLHVLLILAQDGCKWSASCPGHFIPMEMAPVPTEQQAW